MIADECCNASELEAARAVVHDATQHGQKDVFRDGGSVDSSVARHRPHRRMGKTVNQPKNQPPNAQRPDGVVIPIPIDGLERGEDSGDNGQVRVWKNDVVQRQPFDHPIRLKGHENAFMFSFARQDGDCANQVHFS